MNDSNDDNIKNILYVRDYYYNQAIIYQHDSIVSSSSTGGLDLFNMYYDTINIDMYYINLHTTCISITNAYLSSFNGMDYFYHHNKQRHYMEKVCSYYNLATINCELLYWKLYIKYDINNNYKLLTVNEYLDVIIPSLTHSDFRMKIPFPDPNTDGKISKSLEISDLCKYYRLSRKSCTAFMKNYRDAMNRHYGSPNLYADGLYDTIYVMDIIEKILSERGNRISDNDDDNNNNDNMMNVVSDDSKDVDDNADVGIHGNNGFIDVDVVEIGTSNFNTIIGLIDSDDLISGDTMIKYTFHTVIICSKYNT